MPLSTTQTGVPYYTFEINKYLSFFFFNNLVHQAEFDAMMVVVIVSIC